MLLVFGLNGNSNYFSTFFIFIDLVFSSFFSPLYIFFGSTSFLFTGKQLLMRFPYHFIANKSSLWIHFWRNRLFVLEATLPGLSGMSSLDRQSSLYTQKEGSNCTFSSTTSFLPCRWYLHFLSAPTGDYFITFIHLKMSESLQNYPEFSPCYLLSIGQNTPGVANWNIWSVEILGLWRAYLIQP